MKTIKVLSILLSYLMLLTSCMEAASVGSAASQKDANNILGPGTGSGNGATGADNALNNAEVVEQAVVEIRHLIEPKIDDSSDGGTYLKKLTIPKNYDGLLYLAGLNISTLVNDVIKVRFRFGTSSSPIDIDATVSTAAGLTPQTNVQVLILDMRTKPFANIRLDYDLYDYNAYDFSGDGSTVPNEPTLVNRDKNLFCRGLNLEDDPTFEGNLNSGCDATNPICKYSYAKIVDQGLVRVDGAIEIPITPSEVQVQSGVDSYYEDSHALKLSRCLDDNPTQYFNNQYKYDDDFSFTINMITNHLINGSIYQYKGPYRKVSEPTWQIKAGARTGIYGLYKGEIGVGSPYGSKLFPLATKLNLQKDISYIGSEVPNQVKGLEFMAANGESAWMNGCNERASSVDNMTGEHIGSCNVTSKIEIVRIKDDNSEEIITSKEVKLQLVKSATIDPQGDNVLLSSFQSCSSTSQCGSDECCINKRCWDKTVVSSCVEDEPIHGLLEPGQTCSSDYECSSLCCSQTTGRCAVHDTLQDPPVYCAKQSGQKCIAKEWCAKVPVTRCYIIKTGLDAQGGDTCALRCYTFEEHGDCESGTCKPPPVPTMPTFDPNDVNRCAEACDPPDFSNGYFDFKCGDDS